MIKIKPRLRFICTGVALSLLLISSSAESGVYIPVDPMGVTFIPAGEYSVCTQTGGVATQVDMSSGFSSIQSAYAALSQEINLGMEKQSQILSQDVTMLRDTIKNSAIQLSNTNTEKNLAVASPILSSPASSQMLNCLMASSGTGSSSGAGSSGSGSPGAAGVLSGSVNTEALASKSLNLMYTRDLGEKGSTGAYRAEITNATANDISSSNLLPGADGLPSSAPTTSTAGHAYAYNNIVSNPIPLPALPAAAKTTPAGQQYEAIRHVQNGNISLPQEVLNSVSLQNMPTYPLEAFLTNMLKSNNQTGVATLVASNSIGSNISPNTFMYGMNMMYYGNPDFWENEGTSSSTSYYLEQIASMDAVRVNIAYTKLLFKEKMAAITAQADALAVNSNLNNEALNLRNKAVEESINKGTSGSSSG